MFKPMSAKRYKITLDDRYSKYLEMEARKNETDPEMEISMIIRSYLREKYPQMYEDDDFIRNSFDNLNELLR